MTNPSYSFERIADRYEQTRGETILPGGEAARTALIELGGLQPGCRLLDLGTGPAAGPAPCAKRDSTWSGSTCRGA